MTRRKKGVLVNDVSWNDSRTDILNLTVCKGMKMERGKTVYVRRYELNMRVHV